MQQSKFLAALVVLGTFIGGAAIGVAGDRATHAEEPGSHTINSRTYWDRIAAEWKLTPPQRVVIDSLMDAQRRRISALYAPLRPALDSVNDRARAVSDSTQIQLRLVLTAEQRVKLDAMRAELKRRREEHRARRDEDLAKIR